MAVRSAARSISGRPGVAPRTRARRPPGTPRIANPRSDTGVRLLNTSARWASRVAGRLPAVGTRAVDVPEYAAPRPAAR